MVHDPEKGYRTPAEVSVEDVDTSAIGEVRNTNTDGSVKTAVFRFDFMSMTP